MPPPLWDSSQCAREALARVCATAFFRGFHEDFFVVVRIRFTYRTRHSRVSLSFLLPCAKPTPRRKFFVVSFQWLSSRLYVLPFILVAAGVGFCSIPSTSRANFSTAFGRTPGEIRTSVTNFCAVEILVSAEDCGSGWVGADSTRKVVNFHIFVGAGCRFA